MTRLLLFTHFLNHHCRSSNHSNTCIRNSQTQGPNPTLGLLVGHVIKSNQSCRLFYTVQFNLMKYNSKKIRNSFFNFIPNTLNVTHKKLLFAGLVNRKWYYLKRKSHMILWREKEILKSTTMS